MISSINSPHPHEPHKSQRSGWLRAAILGINDGIVSNSSLMLGVAAASVSHKTVLTTGAAGLVAGALSMAVGEYVSVSSQRDSERADIAIEERSLIANPEGELAELQHIYENRGLTKNLAAEVARQLHAQDPVIAHARDELGINHEALPNPKQAMLASALSFSLGALLPIIAAAIAEGITGRVLIVIVSLLGLIASGALGAYLGGGHKLKAALRVLIGGALAMAITTAIGSLIK
jgi:VIT1/CCC1 family predicted Fe2+/Mn2+ transporter